ncbi:MAG: sigma-54 dependent transcriptional regulator [Candidatus Thiodiazotropha sp.]
MSESLSSLGYAPALKDTASWERLGHDNEAVVLFTNPNTCPREHLLERLSDYSCPLILGLFCCGPRQWDRELLESCFDFMTWPASRDELEVRLNRLYAQWEFERQEPIGGAAGSNDFLRFNLIGRAPRFQDTLRLIRKVARCDVPALIEGETGTGKELAARAIHYLSLRQDYPFIPVNCGALAEGLLENELFGHVKGAYTDAKQMQQGLIAQAEGGTLFLDEVDSLSPKGQVSLLRFLQDRKYRPLGGGIPRNADVRIITASNQRLARLVESGHFRQDLLFRLNVMNFTMPALRDRPGDAQLIAEHLMQRYREQYQSPEKRLHPTFIAWLGRHDWPGNVRELENILQREFLLSDIATIHPPHTHTASVLGLLSDTACQFEDMECYGGSLSKAKAQLVERFEKRYLIHLLQESRGNVTLAARLAGKERRAFGKLLKKHGIDRTRYLD